MQTTLTEKQIVQAAEMLADTKWDSPPFDDIAHAIGVTEGDLRNRLVTLSHVTRGDGPNEGAVVPDLGATARVSFLVDRYGATIAAQIINCDLDLLLMWRRLGLI